MSNLIVVGISDQNVVSSPGKLVSYALGSCVGICLYDSLTRVAGLAHILLPSKNGFANDDNILKFADTAAVELVKRMEKIGASRFRMVAKIAGGAQMFSQKGISETAQIGRRNVSAAKQILEALKIKIVAEDTGKNYGRTIEFCAETGILKIRSVSMGTKEI